MLTLGRRNPRCLHYISNSLKNQAVFLYHIWKERLINTRELYRFASERLQNDECLAKQILAQQGLALSEMPDQLKDQIDIVAAACTKAPSAFRFASYRIRNDPDIIQFMCEKHNAYILRYATKSVRNNDVFLNEYFRRNFAKKKELQSINTFM